MCPRGKRLLACQSSVKTLSQTSSLNDHDRAAGWSMRVRVSRLGVRSLNVRIQLQRKLCMKSSRRDGDQDLSGSVPDPRLRKVARALFASRGFQLTLKQAAAIACIEPHYFSAYFGRSMGVTFSRWRTFQRMSHATHLLKSTRLRVGAVARSARKSADSSQRKHHPLSRGSTSNRIHGSS